ncbi:uncharacterized protein knop1 isoform 2-T2 [Pholidichthys leucotaenia]
MGSSSRSSRTRRSNSTCIVQTDSDEDVVFVAEKAAPEPVEITIDQAKRLALQRDIDQESQPKHLSKTLISQGAVEKVEMKEEEKRGENSIEKKKKHKRRKAPVPEDKICTAEDGNLVQVKKEKKKITMADVVAKGEFCEENLEEKKNKKRKISSDFLNDLNGSDVPDEKYEEVVKKKKKKKLLSDNENKVNNVQGSVKDEEMETKKKLKNKSKQIKLERIKEEEAEEQQDVSKKAKNRKRNTSEECIEAAEEPVKKAKKKQTTDERTKIKKDKVAENGIKIEILTTEVEKVKPKKKAKKEFKSEESKSEETKIKCRSKKSKAASGAEVGYEELLSKKRDKSTVTGEKKTELKTQLKKDKYRIASAEVVGVEKKEPKKKKRKKAKHEEEEPSQENLSMPTTEKQSKKSKKKKVSAPVEQEGNAGGEPGAKKKKKKKIKEQQEEWQESSEVDVVFLSEKSGNPVEVSINQERRQVLQMEINKASQPEQLTKPTGFGQWSTAQFDNTAQQQKFLRLMGGFKKGFQPGKASPGGTNMALGKDAQQQLQQGLMGEFEQAHSRRMDFNNRGAGLGFTPLSKKKFSIDINACRSVRFDD